MSVESWLGRDESRGVPSQQRPDFEPPPAWRLDAIYETERPHHPAVSPDGKTVAFILSSGASSDVYTVDVAGGQALRLSTDRSLASYWEDSGPQWSPDGSKIAYTSGDDTCVVDVTGGPPQVLADVRLAAWLDEERMVVIVDSKRTTRLALVNVTEPWPQPFGPTGGDLSQVSNTGDGRVSATFWPRDDFNRADVIVAGPGDDWQTIASRVDRRSMGAVAHGAKIAYVVEDGDWRAVYVTDLDGSSHDLLAKGDFDLGDLAWSDDGSRLAAVRSARGQGDLVLISLDGTVELVAAGGYWQSPHWAAESLVAIHEAHDAPPRLVVVGADSRSILYDGAPAAIAAAPHRHFERVTLRSADGLEFEGLLFRPDDVTGPVAAIVYPHGGPTSVYGDEWDGHAQYFLDKGYAWLAINFRGSTTYGVAFERENHDDWGIGDTADCIAAGRYLQGLDWVDGSRVAIFGASYGSYMALTSLVHADNPFACGVAKYGDCNILTSWAQGDRAGSDDLERMMRHPSSNRDAFHKGSPIHDVERLDKPILIAHGEKDARVHLKQAEELVQGLRRHDKGYEYVTYPEEGHGFLRRESQIHFYKRLERFLDWHLM